MQLSFYLYVYVNFIFFFQKTSANETEAKSGADVDILEAQLESCERRISRLSDENEKLLVKLDASELKCKQLEGTIEFLSKFYQLRAIFYHTLQCINLHN